MTQGVADRDAAVFLSLALVRRTALAIAPDGRIDVLELRAAMSLSRLS
jgi:hypothetical protein